jgi:copper chaperone CopZ
MHCAGCAKSAKEAIERFAGGVVVDLENKIASFDYDPQKINIERIRAAIDDIGFEADVYKTAQVS